MVGFMLTPGQAAFGILASSLSAKVATSMLWRAPTKQGEADRKTDKFKNWSGAQLNSYEYDAPLVAMLLYLSVKGVASPWGATLVCFGQIVYFWGRAITGTFLPCAPLGAMPRYIGMGILI